MITLDFKGTVFTLVVDAEIERETVKQINGVVAFKGSAKEWWLPNTWPCYVDAARTTAEAGGKVTDAAKEHGRDLAAFNSFAIQAKRARRDYGWKLGDVNLFPEQVVDAAWLDLVDGGFLFSDMRTGKSFTALAAVNEMENAFPLLVVTPSNVDFEWERNVQKAFPDKTHAVLSGGMSASARRKALEGKPDIVVVSYKNITKHTKLSYFGGLDKKKRATEIKKGMYDEGELNKIGFRTIIVDEAHNIKDPKSQQTRACWYIGDRCKYRIALTGTPTSVPGEQVGTKHKVDFKDMWALLRFMYPESFPAKHKFENTYLLMQENFFGKPICRGIKPGMEKYWKMIFEPMYVRRLRNIDTRKEYRVIPTEMSTKQRKAYDQAVEFEMAEVDGQLLDLSQELTLRRRLIQLAAATPVVEGNKVVAMTMPSGKVDALMEWLEESDDKAIVFTASRLLFNLVEQQLVDAGYGVASFPGGLTKRLRQEAVDRFRDDPGTNVFLGMLQAANAGIDLSQGKRMAFLDLADDGVMNQQAADRGMGPTQLADVFEIVYFIAKDTKDEEVFESDMRKETNNHELFNDPDSVRRNV